MGGEQFLSYCQEFNSVPPPPNKLVELGQIKAKNGFSTLKLGGFHMGTPWDPALGGLGCLKGLTGLPGFPGVLGARCMASAPRKVRAGQASPLHCFFFCIVPFE